MATLKPPASLVIQDGVRQSSPGPNTHYVCMLGHIFKF